VVIQIPTDSMDSREIIGKDEDGALRNGYIPGSFFHTNGRKYIEDYEQAEHIMQQNQ